VELPVPVCVGRQDLPLSILVMEPGATQQLQGQRIKSVELQIVLPIISLFSCFFI
jgi:hypothetical protein